MTNKPKVIIQVPVGYWFVDYYKTKPELVKKLIKKIKENNTK